MTSTETRAPITKDGVLELNKAESARCGVCGRPGIRKEMTSTTGLRVIVHIPADHACRKPAAKPRHEVDANA